MQFVSRAIHSVWRRPTNDVYLIGLQHLALNDSDVRDEVLRINDLRGAIATDIASGGSAHAETIDAQTGTDAAAQAATLLLCGSLSTAVDGVKGLTKQRLLERYDLFGSLPDVIEDEWIENIEALDERLAEFIEKKKRANAFDIRYADTVDPGGEPWEKCSQVLSRKDVVERLSRGW